MTVTYTQALSANDFHFADACTPDRVENWRRNGLTKVWKTRPGEFRIPVKFGLKEYGYITHENADRFHVAADCQVKSKAQVKRIVELGGNPDEFHPAFDLPAGYVAGWAKGVYYGIDRDGVASS